MKEIRVCEIRAAAAADASKALRLEGRPIVYDQLTKIGRSGRIVYRNYPSGRAGSCGFIRRAVVLQSRLEQSAACKDTKDNATYD